MFDNKLREAGLWHSFRIYRQVQDIQASLLSNVGSWATKDKVVKTPTPCSSLGCDSNKEGITKFVEATALEAKEVEINPSANVVTGPESRPIRLGELLRQKLLNHNL